MSHERIYFLRVLDDVDLLAPQFPDDRLDPGALHPDTGSDGIHVLVLGADRNLGTVASVPHRHLNLDGAVVDLGDFHLEELHQKPGVGTRQYRLGSLGVLIHVHDDGPDPISLVVVLRFRLLLLGKKGLCLAQVHDDASTLKPLHYPVDKFADSRAVLLVNVLALGLTDLLEDDLFGGLSGNTTKSFGRSG